jgi:hypothetical protein
LYWFCSVLKTVLSSNTAFHNFCRGKSLKSYHF